MKGTWKVLLCGLVLVATNAAAGVLSSGGTRIVVGFQPGGSTDTMARIIAPELSKRWGETVIVENKPGASGNIGASDVARSQPNGRTILLATTGIAVSAAVYRHLNYDALKDLVPVALLTTLPNVLVVNPKVPVHSPQEFVSYAKSKPGALNFSSPGAASGQRLAFELFKQITGINIIHVPYKGGAPALQAVVAGQVQCAILNEIEALPFIKSGKLHAIAVVQRKRSAGLPAVPTLAETVAPGFDAPVWQGVMVPAGTPQAVVDKISSDMAAVLAEPAVHNRLIGLGMIVDGRGPDAFGKFLREQIATWAKVAKAANIHLD